MTTVQFDHRILAYARRGLRAGAGAGRPGRAGRSPAHGAGRAAAALCQAALGIVTLVWVVPLHAALAHQAFALILFGLAVANASATRDEAAARALEPAPRSR